MEQINIDTSDKAINEFFDRKVDTILPSSEEFKDLLKSGKRLKFYLGVDVTSPKLHVGHMIPYLKMRQLQKMGHQIIFLVGDFTGKIGDPTDKSAARRKLTDEEVKVNSNAFIEQIKSLFDFNDPVNPPVIKYNSTWNNKLNFSDVIELASNFTVQQMLERDMFANRLKENKPIYLHEFLYPLIQGYDSVAMEVDGEFGGSDQTFNMLAGRTLSKALINKDKFVLTMKLLLSADGVNKMSKSIGNCIYITDSAVEKYGKVMALPDELILHYYELLTDLNDQQLEDVKEKVKSVPMQQKKELAYKIVSLFDNEEKAKQAASEFERTVQNKEIPEQIPEKKKSEIKELADDAGKIHLKDLLTGLKMVNSNSEAKRLIIEGGVELDKKRITDPNYIVDISDIGIIKAGKRKWFKLIN